MDPFVAEIRIVTFNFAPIAWAFCNGQLMPISQNTALFALLGTTYGGDGKSTFALPDMRSRTPMHPGQGLGLSPRALGASGGQTTEVLNQSHMPAHTHGAMTAMDTAGTAGAPSAVRSLAVSPTPVYGPPAQLVPMGDSNGGSAPHENRQPYLDLNFIIALQGVFPPVA
jgi:microcystin-dependent protein